MKIFLVAVFAILVGGGAHCEPLDCQALKSSYEPFQVIRVIQSDRGVDANYVAVYRDPSGQDIAISTLADGSNTSKTTTYGMFALLQENPANSAATIKFEYSGIDPKTFPLDRSATYTVTYLVANGQRVAFKVDYTFIGKKTIELETCRFDVVQYTSRRFNVVDGQEVSFTEGEYSPELNWGNPTLKTSLILDGVKMPATVEHGIIYIDISDDIRPVLEKAFELKPAASVRSFSVDVANFAKFDLVVRAIAAVPAASPTTDEVVSFANMVKMCDATVAAQSQSK